MVKRFIRRIKLHPAKSAWEQQQRDNHKILSAYHQAMYKAIDYQASHSVANRSTGAGFWNNNRMSESSSENFGQKKYSSETKRETKTCISSQEKSERQITRMLECPLKHTWREFLNMSRETSVPYVLHALWRHEQRHSKEPLRFKALPEFPHSFFSISFCWVLGAMRGIIQKVHGNPGEMIKIAYRYAYYMTMLIRKIGYSLSSGGDPNELLIYLVPALVDSSLNDSTRWKVTIQFVEQLLRTYNATSFLLNQIKHQDNQENPKLEVLYRWWNLVLHNSLDVLIPTVLLNWGKYFVSSRSYRYQCSPWFAVLKLYSYYTKHNFCLLWDPLGKTFDKPTRCDGCLKNIGNYSRNYNSMKNKNNVNESRYDQEGPFSTACTMQRSKDYVYLGSQSLLPFCTILHAIIRKFRDDYPDEITIKNTAILANSITGFFSALSWRCPKRTLYCRSLKAEDLSCVIFDEFLLVSLENALKEIPSGWVVYVNLLEEVFHASKILNDEAYAIKKEYLGNYPPGKVTFCSDEVSYLVSGSPTMQYRANRSVLSDKLMPNLIFFRNINIAKQYQHALVLLLDAAVSHLSWYGYQAIHFDRNSELPHWKIACLMINNVQHRINTVTFWSETLNRLKNWDRFLYEEKKRCFAFRIWPPPSRRWTVQNILKLLTAARRFNEVQKLYWNHISNQQKATIGVYLDMLCNELQERRAKGEEAKKHPYQLLLYAQILNIIRIKNMSVGLLECFIGPMQEKKENWWAIAEIDSPRLHFPTLTRGSYLTSCCDNITQCDELESTRHFSNLRLATHSFPLYYFLQILLPRNLFPHIVYHSIKTHGKTLSWKEISSTLRLMKESLWCWQDAMHLYTFSVLPKTSPGKPVHSTVLENICDTHNELFSIFFMKGTCSHHECQIEKHTNKIALIYIGHISDSVPKMHHDHLFIFFLIFRNFAHLITLSIRGEHRLIPTFGNISLDEAFFEQFLTQSAAQILMDTITQLVLKHFVDLAASYPEGEVIMRIIRYTGLLDPTYESCLTNEVARRSGLRERKIFTRFFFQYIGMLMNQCLKYTYLDFDVKERK